MAGIQKSRRLNAPGLLTVKVTDRISKTLISSFKSTGGLHLTESMIHGAKVYIFPICERLCDMLYNIRQQSAVRTSVIEFRYGLVLSYLSDSHVENIVLLNCCRLIFVFGQVWFLLFLSHSALYILFNIINTIPKKFDR